MRGLSSLLGERPKSCLLRVVKVYKKKRFIKIKKEMTDRFVGFRCNALEFQAKSQIEMQMKTLVEFLRARSMLLGYQVCSGKMLKVSNQFLFEKL